MSNEDSFTEVSSTSFGERVGNSFKGILLGLLLFVSGTGLLYWNEGRAVRTGDAINEAQMATVTLPSIETIDTSFNGKMVHATGKAVTTDELKDPVTNISANAIALIRKVSYYQWVQSSTTKETKNLDGSVEKTTTYSYEKEWTDKPVSSAHFKKPEGHQNTLMADLETRTWTAKNVTFGAYTLPDFLIHAVGGAEDFSPVISEASLQKNLFPHYEESAENVPLVHVRQNTLYLGEEPHAPNIGDMRIVYSAKPQGNVSILARVQGNTFDKFLASNGEKFYQLHMGIVGTDSMYQDARDANNTLTWILRGVGMALVIIGLNIFIAPLSTIASIIPLLGDLFGAGAALVASILGIAWSFVIIAVAWMRFRPILGISLLAAALGLLVFLYIRGRNKKKAVH